MDNNPPSLPEILTPIDKAALLIGKDNPTLTNAEIAHEVVGLGITKHPESVFRAFVKRDYVSKELGKVRANHRDRMSRLIVPMALQAIYNALRPSSKLSQKDKYPWVKLVVDKEFGEEQPIRPARTVPVSQIQNFIQVTINQGSEKDRE